MPYEGPVTKEALNCMEEIRKLDVNNQYHFSESTLSIKNIAEFEKKISICRAAYEEHQKHMKEGEMFLTQWKEKLVKELTTQEQLHLETQPVPIELGRTE